MSKPGAGMSKSQAARFAKLMSAFGGATEEEIEEATKEALYNAEQMAYELQAVHNFFTSRIQPSLERKVGESEATFNARQDAAYHEWRFKECKGCHERFAYAYDYDCVAFCSLDCLENALLSIGIVFSRHKDLKRRWGARYPAIVPASALQVLEDAYSEQSPQAFVS